MRNPPSGRPPYLPGDRVAVLYLDGGRGTCLGGGTVSEIEPHGLWPARWRVTVEVDSPDIGPRTLTVPPNGRSDYLVPLTDCPSLVAMTQQAAAVRGERETHR